MRIASASKAYNGAAALALVARGALSLDDTIGELLPRFPRAWHAVTLRQLLNHTSGLPDYFGLRAQRALAASPGRAPSPDRLLDFVADRPLLRAGAPPDRARAPQPEQDEPAAGDAPPALLHPRVRGRSAVAGRRSAPRARE